MDHTANGHTDEPTEVESHAFQGLGSFVSFSDDLHKLEEALDVEDNGADLRGFQKLSVLRLLQKMVCLDSIFYSTILRVI